MHKATNWWGVRIDKGSVLAPHMRKMSVRNAAADDATAVMLLLFHQCCSPWLLDCVFASKATACTIARLSQYALNFLGADCCNIACLGQCASIHGADCTTTACADLTCEQPAHNDIPQQHQHFGQAAAAANYLGKEFGSSR